MILELSVAVIATLLAQTAAIVWWGATLTTTVKTHERQLTDHEERLREAGI